MYKKLSFLIKSMRPSQWPKNLVVFTAFFFSINESWSFNTPFDALTIFGELIVVFFVFCLLSGAVYILNDIKDIEFDRNHPYKRFRPIAAGKISINLAILFSSLIILLIMIVSFAANKDFAFCLLGYLLITILYSLILKKIVVLDVSVIAIGFVIRVVSGAIVAEVPISLWLYLCTGLGALILGFSKRRAELMLGGVQSTKYRSVFKFYSLTLIDRFIWMVSASFVLAYAFYTYSAPNLPTNRLMMLTIPLVVFGVWRFLHLLKIGRVKLQPEDTFFRDKLLLIGGLFWVIGSVTILYLYRG